MLTGGHAKRIAFSGQRDVWLVILSNLCYKQISVEQSEEVVPMELTDKARIRLETWISHNDHHREEYEMFVEQLEQLGKKESAKYIKEMMDMTAKGTECLRKALKALD
ncbi:MAG: hypothetical protein KKE57_04965 [Proteobacteria bacterium]|nr:hypothetical protein [Pseudomonadota bacterium]